MNDLIQSTPKVNPSFRNSARKLVLRSVPRALKISFVLFIVIVIPFNYLWTFRSNELRDFGSFIAAGRASTEGRNPYSTDEPSIYHVILRDAGIDVVCPNLNPPISVPIFNLLVFIDPLKALTIWRILSSILYILSITLLIRAYSDRFTFLHILLALSLAGWWHNLELGQIYAILVLSVTGVWLLFRSRHFILAGILIGLIVAIKPQFAIWPLFLLLLGYWSTVLSCVISFSVLWLWPAIIYGPNIYLQWMNASSQYGGIGLLNFSLIGLTMRFGSMSLGIVLGLLLVISLLLWIWRVRPDLSHISSLALIASLLVSPITWSGYLLVLLPIFFERDWSNWIKVVLVILIIPVPVLLTLFTTSWVNSVIWGWMYGWALLLLLIIDVRSTLSSITFRTQINTSSISNIDLAR